MAEQYIWIVTDATPVERSPSGSRGDNMPRNPFDQPIAVPTTQRPGIPVSVEKLENGVSDFLDTMGRVLTKAQDKAKEIGGMELEEIELSVEVNGEGQLSLLGSGTKVGGSGALTLKFKRTEGKASGESF